MSVVQKVNSAARLNAVPAAQGGPLQKLSLTGKMNDTTLKAIRHFQQQQFGWQDGVVDPNKVTITRLRSLVQGGGLVGGGGGNVNTGGSIDVERVLTAAKNATREGVVLFKVTVTIQGTIMAVTATGGKVTAGASFEGSLKNAMKAAGAPDSFSGNFASAAFGAWKAYWDNYTIPGLPWYPTFAAIPSTFAPPTPNVPTPIAAGVSGALSGMQSGVLAANIRSRVYTSGIASERFALRRRLG